MTYTSHGHYINGTEPSGIPAPHVVECGGLERCAECSKEAVRILMSEGAIETELLFGDNHANYQNKAMGCVSKFIKAMWFASGKEPPTHDLYVVWFSKTLQNWKALVGSTLNDGLYYEVTYNGDKGETYLDAYMKIQNMVIPD